MACDSYNGNAEDIALLKLTGAKVYRFSLSWSRIIPTGGRNDPVNRAGLDFYCKFVDDLLAASITPMITVLHWDLPQGLEERYGGFLNKEEFVAEYAHYARIVFGAIPKCKHWITFNEPWYSSVLGYNVGVFAPGRTSDRTKSDVGDSSTECWLVGHNLILAHAHAVRIYRDEFKVKDGGEVGSTLNGIATSFPFIHMLANTAQVTPSTPGIQKTRETSKPPNAHSSSPSPDSPTPSTTATIPPP